MDFWRNFRMDNIQQNLHAEEIIRQYRASLQLSTLRIRSVKCYVEVEIWLHESVHKLKVKIEEVEGTQPYLQVLTFAGQELEDGRTLSDYNIQNESTIHLSVRRGALTKLKHKYLPNLTTSVRGCF